MDLNGSDIKGKIEWRCVLCNKWFEVPWDYRERPENCPHCDEFIGNSYP